MEENNRYPEQNGDQNEQQPDPGQGGCGQEVQSGGQQSGVEAAQNDSIRADSGENNAACTDGVYQSDPYQGSHQNDVYTNGSYQNGGFQTGVYQNGDCQNNTYQDSVCRNGGRQNNACQNSAYQNNVSQNSAYQSNVYQNSTYQNGVSQDSAYQNNAYQNSAYQNNTYQNSAYQNNAYQNGAYSGGNTYQNYGTGWQPYHGVQQYPNEQLELEEPVKVSEWVLALVLMMIPCVNIIMMFVWAFSKTEKKSKSNFFKAYLIFFGISMGVLLVVWIAIVFFALMM